ncbi:hypothetical protein [Legionella antarctica]|uniref:hypothetical protein n=1 Tax=Legionella antarctica TaxID=2708020 RepID=UPI001563F997|nr:hypothetical protein [Legionella antarctica]
MMGEHGLELTQSASRREEKKAFAKHMVRFRHRNYHEQDGGLFPELVRESD